VKPILTFVLGAVLASGVAYYVVQSRSPQPQETAQNIPSVPVDQPATDPNASATTESKALTPTPADGFGTTAQSTPSASTPSPSVTPSRREQTRRNEPRTTASARESQARTTTSTRESQQPAQTAENTAPANNTPPRGPNDPAPQPLYTPPPANAPRENEPPRPEPRRARTVTIPAGTLVTVRLEEELDSSKNQSGDQFRASLDQPLVVDGFVLAERGARVSGRVVEVDPGGRVKGRATMSLALTTINTSDGQRVNVQTESFTKQATADTKGDAAKIGGAAAVGAVIGAIAGGGKGAAIGAGVGGAAGTGGVMATRGRAANLPVETKVSFRIAAPVTLTERLRN
jgi:hypothetical protein